MNPTSRTGEREALAERLCDAYEGEDGWYSGLRPIVRERWLRVADAALATGDAATWEATADRIGTELVEVRERASRAEALLRRWRKWRSSDMLPLALIESDTDAFLNLSAAPGHWVPKRDEVVRLAKEYADKYRRAESSFAWDTRPIEGEAMETLSDLCGAVDALLAAEREATGLPATDAGGEARHTAPLYCPSCKARHVDEGEWATRPHHKHLCAACGYLWRVEPYTFGEPLAEPIAPARPTTPGAERGGEDVGALRDAFVEALAAEVVANPRAWGAMVRSTARELWDGPATLAAECASERRAEGEVERADH